MYLGIDFGTTFSQAATMYLEQPFLLLSPGEYGIPSEFYYDREYGILVGQEALDAGVGNSAVNLKSEVKMDLMSSFTADGKTFQSKDIVREIYKAIVTKAVQIAKTRSINTAIDGVVISVPAKFGMQERNLIYKAAKECMKEYSLRITDIIKEPVAAAIAYYNTDLEDDKTVLVYDLGGGTCDVALVKADSSRLEHYDVIDSDMVRLGGRNWDRQLMQYITEIVEHKSNITIKGNPGYEEKIRRAAISVKKDLSDPAKSRAFARIELNGRIVPVPVTRSIFDEITRHLLDETLDCLQGVYDRYCTRYSISEIICVGGSSNMLQVEEGIKKRFPQCNVHVYMPEHAVVNGAAIYADILGGKTGNGVVLSDMASFSYGVECYEDYDKNPDYYIISNIIKKGGKLPVSGRKSFLTVRDNQTRLSFDVYESEFSEDTFPKDNKGKRYVGNVTLSLPPQMPKNTSAIVNIKLNNQGLLEVEATGPHGEHVGASFNINEL